MATMQRMYRAEKFHRRSLLTLGWSVLREPYRLMQVKETAVRAQHQWNLLRCCWHDWQRLIDRARARDGQKYASARAYYHAVLKVKMIAKWQESAQEMKAERRAHLRRLEMRTRVDGWLQEETSTSSRSKLVVMSKNPYK